MGHSHSHRWDRVGQLKDVIRVTCDHQAPTAWHTARNDVSVDDTFRSPGRSVKDRTDLASESEVGINEAQHRLFSDAWLVAPNGGLKCSRPPGTTRQFGADDRRHDDLAAATVGLSQQRP
jgi:hypothetical protein